MGRTVYPRRSEVPLRSSARPNKNENNTVWPHFMRWVQWPSKTIDTQVELHARRLFSSLLWDSVWIKRATERIVLKENRCTPNIKHSHHNDPVEGQTNGTSKGALCQPAPKLSVRTCQLTLTARHAQYVKKNTCATRAVHTGVMHSGDEL